MKILVTGSTSLIARHVGTRLQREHEVLYAGRDKGDLHLDLAAGFETYPRGQRFDAVIHCAADFGGTGPDDLARAALVNGVGTANVARLATEAGARHFVYISSILAAYGPGHPYHNAYSVTKRQGEELAALHCARHGMPLAILRPTQVYGETTDFGGHQPLLYGLIEKAARGEDITLGGSRDVLRNYLHVDDLTDVVAAVVTQGITGLHVVADDRSWRLTDIIAMIHNAFSTGGSVTFDPARPDIPELEEVDGAPIRALTGLGNAISLKEGIARIRKARNAP